MRRAYENAIKDFILYLHKAGHGEDDSGALFRPLRDSNRELNVSEDASELLGMSANVTFGAGGSFFW